jgi:hypothetical protein
MNMFGRVVLIITFGSAILFSGLSVPAQGKRNLLAPVSQPRPAAASVPRAPRVTFRTVYTQVVVKEKVKIAFLNVTSHSGAKVVLESLTKTRKPYKKEITTGDDGTALFQDLAPGDYKLEASKDGFETVKSDKITIVPQKGQSTSLYPKDITYKLKIATNLINVGGDIRFAPAIYKGKDAQDNIISEQLGPYCVAKIPPSGIAEISDLKKGYYDIDIRPASLEFEDKFSGIDLTIIGNDEDESEDSSILKTYKIDLEKNQSTETFLTTWVASDWDLPSTWRLDRGMKVKNADGVAIPQNPRYRQYVNFELIANVKLKENGTAGFVLRAQDNENYYLFQISGERGETPNTAVLYAIKMGQRQQLATAPAGGFAKTLASDSGFELKLLGDESGFTVWIGDSDTGKISTLGRLPDQFNTFKKGAVGIAGSAKSNFEVKTFQVCTPACPK